MATSSPAPSATPELKDWLSQLPEVPGVRALDRMPGIVMRPRMRANYRRQAAPGESASAAAPQQEIFSLVRESGVLRWRAGAAAPAQFAGPRPRAGGRAALAAGEVVKQFRM